MSLESSQSALSDTSTPTRPHTLIGSQSSTDWGPGIQTYDPIVGGYGGFNKNGFHRRIYLNSHQGVELSERIRRIRRHGLLVGVSVSLWEGFGVSKAHSRPRLSFCLLPADQVVKLSATSPV